MQNESFLDEGREGANAERKDTPLASASQIEQALPLLPPPSLDPSSFTTHDLSLFVSIPATGREPVSDNFQIAQLFSLVAQLKSEQQDQKSSIEQLSSTVARLVSENTLLGSELALLALLKRANKDQELVIGELSRAAIPGGFWIWESRREEGREDEGRWVWSLEKYKVLPLLAVAAGPPTSLLSLPVELLTVIILDLLDRKERLVLCRVSFKLLELASEHIYVKALRADAARAVNLVESRVLDPSPKSDRITTLLLPKCLYLFGSPVVDAFNGLVKLASTLASTPSPLRVTYVTIAIAKQEDFKLWVNLLRFVDPVGFDVRAGDKNSRCIPPTIRFVPADFVASFTPHWTRLERASASGIEAVLLLEGTDETSAFEACHRRCSPDLPFVHVSLGTKENGVATFKTLGEDRLSSLLATEQNGEGEVKLVWLNFKMGKAKMAS